MPAILDPSVPFDYLEFLLVFATVLMGVISLGSTIIGYLRDKSTKLERCATGLAAGCLLFHEYVTSVIGFLIMVGIYLIQLRRSQRGDRLAPTRA
jgi:TRAP-type uncharacterized transport system fused permease subunit